MKENRKKPISGKAFLFPLVLGIVFFAMGISLVLMEMPIASIIFFIAGGLVILWPALEIFTPDSTRNQFLRSAEEAIAKVIFRHWDVREDSYGGSHRHYYFVLGFRAQKNSIGLIDMELKTYVTRKIFNKFQTGEQVKVRYAKDDPCIALVEGEF